MSLYRPPTAVVTSQIPYESLVTQTDPSWQRDKFWDIEYWFSGRVTYYNPLSAGPYNRQSNVYNVGAAYGPPDPLIEAALAPTVGNEVPGLYEGVPDGKGWA